MIINVKRYNLKLIIISKIHENHRYITGHYYSAAFILLLDSYFIATLS